MRVAFDATAWPMSANARLVNRYGYLLIAIIAVIIVAVAARKLAWTYSFLFLDLLILATAVSTGVWRTTPDATPMEVCVNQVGLSQLRFKPGVQNVWKYVSVVLDLVAFGTTVFIGSSNNYRSEEAGGALAFYWVILFLMLALSTFGKRLLPMFHGIPRQLEWRELKLVTIDATPGGCRLVAARDYRESSRVIDVAVNATLEQTAQLKQWIDWHRSNDRRARSKRV